MNENGSVMSNWQPRGRLINTFHSAMHNNFPDPVNNITISNNSSESKHPNILLTGAKHGTLQMYTIDDSDSEIKLDLTETMLITDLEKSKQINSISIINEESNF